MPRTLSHLETEFRVSTSNGHAGVPLWAKAASLHGWAGTCKSCLHNSVSALLHSCSAAPQVDLAKNVPARIVNDVMLCKWGYFVALAVSIPNLVVSCYRAEQRLVLQPYGGNVKAGQAALTKIFGKGGANTAGSCIASLVGAHWTEVICSNPNWRNAANQLLQGVRV